MYPIFFCYRASISQAIQFATNIAETPGVTEWDTAVLSHKTGEIAENTA